MEYIVLYAIVYVLLYLGSIALLTDQWRSSWDVTLGDLIFFAMISVALIGWVIWPIERLSRSRQGKTHFVVFPKKDITK